MPLLDPTEPRIIRNERGLSINGTRITIYDVMDGLRSNQSVDRIAQRFNLTDEQVRVAVEFIEVNRSECDREYDEAAQEFEECKQYWTERNRQRLAEIAAMPPDPGKELIREKIDAWKQQRVLR